MPTPSLDAFAVVIGFILSPAQEMSVESQENSREQLERQLALAQGRVEELAEQALRLRAAERRSRQVTETFQAASLALTRTFDLDEILESLLDYLGQLVLCDSATIFLLEGEADLVARAARGYERWTDVSSAQIVGIVRFDIDRSPRHRTLVTSQRSLIIPDIQKDPSWRHIASSTHVRNWMGVPLVAGGKTIGLYSLDKAEPHFFTQEHQRWAEALAAQAAIAIQNAFLYRRTERELAERQQAELAEREQRVLAEALRDIGALLNSTLSLDEVLEGILTHVSRVVPSRAGSILLIKGDSVEVARVRGYDLSLVGFPFPLTLPHMLQVLETGRPVVIDNVLEYDGWVATPTTSWIRSNITAAIYSGREIIGFLSLERDTPGAFTPEHVERLQAFANQAGIAVRNARLFEAEQEYLAELKQAGEAAEAANRAKSVFLANMSHELRTPLNAILGFAQLMARDSGLSVEQQEHLAIIGRSGEHLLALISDVLELSKIEAGRTELHEESFDLYHMLAGLEEMFRLRAADKGLSLLFERAEDTPQYVCLDQGKLRQVLINLLGNACKFTERGGVVLRAGRAEGGGALHFEVQDTGMGIAPDDVGALFDAFVQTASGQQSQEGTGLGLPISLQFVRLMGGDIHVTSTPGEGSLFQFDVHYEPADAADVRTARPRRRVIGLTPGQCAADGNPYRLLVVEDREVGRRLLVKLLQPLGFEVREAANGREAIQVWQQWAPHLIWMDIKMPVMDGYEATRRIRAMQRDRATRRGEAAQDTVIVALTASALEYEQTDISAAGCDDLVRKPFREDEILEKLAQHLGVGYLYESEAEEGQPRPGETRPEPAATSRDALTAGRLAALVASTALPPDLVVDLQRATVQGRYADMLAIAEHIREHDALLADGLQALIEGFEYDLLLALIERAGAPAAKPATE